MTKTVEAVLEPSGEIRLLEPLRVSKSTRVFVTVVPERSVAELYQELRAEADTPEASARREQAIADYHAGKTLTTAEAIKLFELRVADAGKK